MPSIHVRYNGQSQEIPFETIFTPERLAGIGLAGVSEVNVNSLTPDQVKMSLAQHMDIGVSEFGEYQIDYHKNGNITVRPEAEFA